MKKVKMLLTKILMVCVILSCFAMPTFAGNVNGNTSNGTNSGSGTTGYGEDNFEFTVEPDGTFKMQIAGQEGGKSATTTFGSLYDKFRVWCAGATGIVILICMFMLIVGFGGLAIHANNSQERSRVSAGLAYKVMAAAGVVATPLIIGLASNLFM